MTTDDHRVTGDLSLAQHSPVTPSFQPTSSRILIESGGFRPPGRSTSVGLRHTHDYCFRRVLYARPRGGFVWIIMLAASASVEETRKANVQTSVRCRSVRPSVSPVLFSDVNAASVRFRSAVRAPLGLHLLVLSVAGVQVSPHWLVKL